MDGTIVLEPATGPRFLVTLANKGLDAEAPRIICKVARQLHTAQGAPGLLPLTTWFEPLAPPAQAQGGILSGRGCGSQAAAAQREIVPLHADRHHENIHDFGERGRLATTRSGSSRTHLR